MAANRYAASTDVPADRSRSEIERTLERYDATSFAYGWEGSRALIGFRIGARQYRYLLPLPDRNADEFRYTPARGYERSASDQKQAWEQACRQRWRALALVVKANLEAVEAGILTVEQAFLGATMLPSGATVQEWLEPQIAETYRTGQMPALLPGLPALGEG